MLEWFIKNFASGGDTRFLFWVVSINNHCCRELNRGSVWLCLFPKKKVSKVKLNESCRGKIVLCSIVLLSLCDFKSLGCTQIYFIHHAQKHVSKVKFGAFRGFTLGLCTKWDEICVLCSYITWLIPQKAIFSADDFTSHIFCLERGQAEDFDREDQLSDFSTRLKPHVCFAMASSVPSANSSAVT